jgi:hypothetical protein
MTRGAAPSHQFGRQWDRVLLETRRPHRHWLRMSDNGTPGKRPAAPSMEKRPEAEPMTLILRRSRKQARIEGLNPDIFGADDYVVIDGDTVIGRIYPELIQGEPKWRWFLQTVPALPPNSGVDGTLEEAKAEFKRRYAEVKDRP